MELPDGGEYVVANELFRAVMKGTEDEVEIPVGMTFALREGKVTELRFFRTSPKHSRPPGCRSRGVGGERGDRAPRARGAEPPRPDDGARFVSADAEIDWTRSRGPLKGS
ncbi:MAG: hypothetical protein K0S65_176 [Labilithrix sp.]|nr:hypothetical protein [Labilithrix sp.]